MLVGNEEFDTNTNACKPENDAMVLHLQKSSPKVIFYAWFSVKKNSDFAAPRLQTAWWKSLMVVPASSSFIALLGKWFVALVFLASKGFQVYKNWMAFVSV